jgi:hypothetical protein
MFKFQRNALLFGVMALCFMFACTKATEPTNPTPTDDRPTLKFNVNGATADFKVGAVLVKDSNTFSVGFEYLINPGPNFIISIINIPNKIGTHEITKSGYPSFKTNGNIFVLNGDAVYDTYYVFENVDNNFTILTDDVANQKITGNLKCTFVRENDFPKNHSYPDTLVIEKSGLELPYKVN